jgi:hypothetical protein
MQSDGLHPTAEGNAKIAATVMKYLEPLLKKCVSLVGPLFEKGAIPGRRIFRA